MSRAEQFESEWKRYCDSKGGGAVTMNVKDVARHFYEQAEKDFIIKAEKWIAEEFKFNDARQYKYLLKKFKQAMSE